VTGSELKSARHGRGWTQEEAARKLRVTQAYLSMLESGRRAVPDDLALKVANVLPVSPVSLPLRQERSNDLAADLGALGYSGFAYLAASKRRNPARVLLDALTCTRTSPRVFDALPWLVYRFAHMNWGWIVPRIKVRDLQNRLGFVVTQARRMAEEAGDTATADALRQVVSGLERSRLLAEDTFSGSALTNAEREWLRENRSDDARFWNVLTDLRLEQFDASR
jgi:transcriptional regulator with XRE-family HTH domain